MKVELTNEISAFFRKDFGCTGSCCCVGFSLVVLSEGYSLVVMHRLLILVGFSCCEAQAPGLMGFSSCGMRAQQLQFPGSRVQGL